ALALSKLWMSPQIGDRVDACIGNAGRIQSSHDFTCIQRRKGLDDDRLELAAGRDAACVGRKYLLTRQVRRPQHLCAKDHPLPFVLQAQHDLSTIAGCEWTVGID